MCHSYHCNFLWVAKALIRCLFIDYKELSDSYVNYMIKIPEMIKKNTVCTYYKNKVDNLHYCEFHYVSKVMFQEAGSS